ncbi:MAG: hypothetical protein ACI4XF_03145 [Oscillospiraceae bacterium]
MKRKRILAAVCAAAVLTLSGCSDELEITEDTDIYDDFSEETAQKVETEPKTEAVTDKISASGLSMAIDDSGRLAIKRSSAGSVPMGEDGTWTVFVWLCGTDLESGSGFATGDIEEMLEASTGSNVRFVIQTGGTFMWQNSVIDSSDFQRYVIKSSVILPS